MTAFAMTELKSYKMTDGGTMVLCQDQRGRYEVAQYTAGDICRWSKMFDKASDADVEYEKWHGYAAGN